jgi:hypothetical protein
VGGVDHFEHLVRVNDPVEPRLEWLAREALWEGLWRSVAAAGEYDPSVDECTLESLGEDRARRRLRRGPRLDADLLEWRHNESITVRPDPQGPFAGSSLEMRIEEPAPAILFVRFTYDLVGGDGQVLTEPERVARHAAWQQADLARIRTVRAHARQPRPRA